MQHGLVGHTLQLYINTSTPGVTDPDGPQIEKR